MSQQIIGRRKSSKVHVLAEIQLRQAKSSSRRSSEYSENCLLKYMVQQRISRLKPNKVYASAENQNRKATSHAHLNYAVTEARNLSRLFSKRIVIRHTKWS
jgi:hypothetical protein